MQKILHKIFILVFCCFSPITFADLHLERFQLKPTATLETLSGDATIARLQSLLPLAGNTEEIWFTALDGKIGLNNNGWMLGLGSGLRKVYLEKIFGAYFFADYSATPSHNKIWIFNPGVEMLGNIWDLHLNGYFPSQSSVENKTFSQGFASDYNHNRYLSFTEHKEFDNPATLETSSHTDFATGLDFTLGYSFPNLENFKISLGAYHFTTKHNGNIHGALAHLSYKLNDHVSLEVRESYDNWQHNRILVGLNFTLSGLDSNAKKAWGLSAHLLDPIENNNSVISNGYATFSKTSREKKITISKENVLAHDKVWFIGGEQDGDGSHEHPWANLTQENIDIVSKSNMPETRIYLAPNNYTSRILLPQGVSLMGRNSDYTKINSLDQRPLLFGSLELSGNNRLDSIELLPSDREDQTAIFLNNNANNVNISNCNIGDKKALNQYSTGILGDSIKNLNIKDSNIYVKSNTDNAYGIYVHHVDNLTLDHSSIEATASNYSNEKRHSGNAYGILVGYDYYENDFSNINAVHDNNINIINNSRISAISNGKSTADDTGNAYAILVGYGFGWSYALDKNLDITRNNVNLLQSSLTANANNLADCTFLAGNSYGILIGYAAGSGTSTDTPNSLATTYNSLRIENSDIIAISKVAIASLAGGNAFAILVGDGYMEGETAYGTSYRKVNLDISQNNIDISKSNLKSTGSSGEYGKHSGNSYALALGFGFNESTGRQDGIVSSNIDHNTINIATTALSANSNSDGYSILLGYASSEGGSESGKRFLEITNNKLNLSDSTLGSYSNSEHSNSYGLNFAQNSTRSFDNNLSISNTTFNISSNNQNAYGIYLQGINLEALNITQNTFNVSSQNPLNSFGIYNANSTQFWPESLIKTLLQDNQFADSIKAERRVWQ
ncbi:MAG: hypothetical protein WCW01_04030 [Gammaproteobacteria bacterium]